MFSSFNHQDFHCQLEASWPHLPLLSFSYIHYTVIILIILNLQLYVFNMGRYKQWTQGPAGNHQCGIIFLNSEIHSVLQSTTKMPVMASHITMTTSITTSCLFQCLIITSTAQPEYYTTCTVLFVRHASHFPNN